MTGFPSDPAELRHRLAEQTLDLRTLNLSGFRVWLDRQLQRWQSDPVFAQRARIRDLRKAHPEIHRLDAVWRQATQACAAKPEGRRLAALGKRQHDVHRAIAGLDQALRDAPPERLADLSAKRDHFRAEQARLAHEEDAITHSSPEHQAALRAAADLRRVWEATGLDREMVRLQQLQKNRGRGTGRAGSAFEDEAIALVTRQIVPSLEGRHLHVLSGVRLGAADLEFDIVIVDRPGGHDQPVHVKAVVEAKRNINDLAHGFLRRQADLGWLRREERTYDPARHRTRRFPTGHFDRPAVHWEDGEAYRFEPDAFARFERNSSTGYFQTGLYLITRNGPIWGVSGANRARIEFRVSTDEHWDMDNASYLAHLFDWSRSLAGPVESPDILRIYTESVERTRHLCLIA